MNIVRSIPFLLNLPNIVHQISYFVKQIRLGSCPVGCWKSVNLWQISFLARNETGLKRSKKQRLRIMSL
jgi:hypothetical protein